MHSESNQKGYIRVVVKNRNFKAITALIDSGNSLAAHGCIRGDIAKDLELPITKDHLIIGSADSKQNIETIGSTSLEILIEIKNQLIPFRMSLVQARNGSRLVRLMYMG